MLKLHERLNFAYGGKHFFVSLIRGEDSTVDDMFSYVMGESTQTPSNRARYWMCKQNASCLMF